jgi:hypothetical protein
MLFEVPMDEVTAPQTITATLERVDRAWAGFWHAAHAFPGERLGERLNEDGWTRKQMLAHVAVWHDLTARRLAEFARTGQRPPLGEHEDVVNARAARSAEGRTVGEILEEMDASFRRLRRQLTYLPDTLLTALDGWAAAVIAGNSYGHYSEHLPDLEALPEPAGPRLSSAS